MQIGLVGLGKMGFNLVLNLQRNRYDLVAYNLNLVALKSIQQKVTKTATSLREDVQSRI